MEESKEFKQINTVSKERPVLQEKMIPTFSCSSKVVVRPKKESKVAFNL